jgi:hypothetical protein
MLRGRALLIGAFVVMGASAANAADERAIVFNFTPTERAQIAIWVESADGTFLSTVGLTQAVSVRGIGNRPGASQMNSGLPLAVRSPRGRAADLGEPPRHAPGAVPFPRVVFQHRPEGYASRTCEDSTRDSYFCLSFTAESTRREGLDASRAPACSTATRAAS